ncbi:hypothetical protein M422DRAFT_184162, partial [Sphaerobolus stellatus SS14]
SRSSGPCTTGTAQCCDSTTTASDPSVAGILSLVGVVVQGVDIMVGTGCTPISVIGAGQGANWYVISKDEY